MQSLTPEEKKQLQEMSTELWTATDEDAALGKIKKKNPALHSKVEAAFKELHEKIESLHPDAKAFVKEVG